MNEWMGMINFFTSFLWLSHLDMRQDKSHFSPSYTLGNSVFLCFLLKMTRSVEYVIFLSLESLSGLECGWVQSLYQTLRGHCTIWCLLERFYDFHVCLCLIPCPKHQFIPLVFAVYVFYSSVLLLSNINQVSLKVS